MLISEIQHSEESSEEKKSDERDSKESYDGPVPTRHDPVVERSQIASNGGGPESAEEVTTPKNETDPDRRRATPLTELSVDANKPHLLGGKGSLYLHINYPYQARVEGIEGRLKLRFTVTSNGDVRRIDVEKSLHPLCDSAAVRALRSVRFQPAKRRGEPIPVRMSLPIRFELKKPDTSSYRATRWNSGG